MDYGLFFSTETGGGVSAVRLPVNPERYGIQYPGDTKTYNVLGLGEVIKARTPKLFELSWDGVFPGRADYPGVATGGQFREPKFYIDTFLGYQNSGEPVWFTAVRVREDGTPLFDTNERVIVEDFSFEERGGETGDFHYSLSLRGYRDFKPQVGAVVEVKEAAIPLAAVVVEPQRDIPTGQLYVGCTVVLNGRYYSDSYGGGPHGTASNRRGTVSRIITTDPGRPMPVHVNSETGGALGWVAADQLRVSP